MSTENRQGKIQTMKDEYKTRNDVFFQAVSVKDLPGVMEINQTIYFHHLSEDNQEELESLVHYYNTSSGEGVFSFGKHGVNSSLTFTQKVVVTTLRNKPQNLCLSLLTSGMIHLKALLFDSNISEEVICNDH